MRFRVLGLIVAAALAGAVPGGAGAATKPATPVASWVTEIKSVVQLDPARGEHLAAEAEKRARLLPPSPENLVRILTAQWLRAEAMIQLNRSREAASIIEQALRSMPEVAVDTKLHGDLLMARGGVFSGDGKAHEALADYQAAYKIYVHAGQSRAQAIALQAIGSIYQDAGDFQRVLYYYALSDVAAPNDPLISLSSNNNQANALAELRRFGDAEQKFRAALGFARELGSAMLEARILNNIAATQIDTGQLDKADATIARGLRLARQPEAEAWRPMLLATSARAALSRGQPQSAVALIEDALKGRTAEELANQSFRDLHRVAYLAYKAAGDRRSALEHFEAYTKLDNEGRSLVTLTSASLLAARFDFANQNARISELRAGQLRRDIALSRAQARQNALILGGLLTVVTIVAILLGWNLRTSRRSRRSIEAANAELSRTNVDLEDALSAKSAFLATTSHEIRTPLNGMLGMTQVLLADRGLVGGMRERIALVHGAGETMRMLVDDILEFAKIDAGVLETHKAEMDLLAVLHETIGLWETQAMDKGLTLSLSADGVPRLIVEDQRRLRQILLNLLSNAVKFTPSGSIIVRAEVEADDDGERLVIAVTDSGIGVPEAAYATIFEKFSQLDTSTTRRFGGTGLGLAISRSIAVALGGEVTVHSIVGTGSTFTLRLPLVRAEVPPVPAELSPAEHGRNLAQAGVLLVGGGLIGQSVIRSVVQAHVASFTAVATVDAALDQARRQPPDVVIVDGATVGLEEVQPLVAGLAGLAAGSRVLAIWAADDPAAMIQLRDHSVDAMLTRPLNGVLLLDTLNSFFFVEKGLAESDEAIVSVN